MTDRIRPDSNRLTLAYLIALPLFLLTGGVSVILAFFLAPPTPVTVGVTAYLLPGVLTLSGLVSAAFVIFCYAKTQPSAARLLVMAVVTLHAGLYLSIFFPLIVYALTLYVTRKYTGISIKALFLRTILPILIVILLISALCLASIWLWTGDHFYSEPTVGKGGFYHTELMDASLMELVEVDDSHCIGVYSYATDDPSRGVGFALYETKVKDGKPLYCYLDDSGLCFPFIDAIEENDGEHYTVDGHDVHGFPERRTYSWSTWHRVSDGYAVCLIPAESDAMPEEGIEVVQNAEVTLREKAFRLYVGIGKVE